MIKLGYTNKLYVVLRILCVATLSFFLLFGKDNEALRFIVQATGGLCIGSGLISLLYSIIKKESIVLTNILISIGLGILLVFKPELVINSVILIIGIALLIFGGLQTFAILMSASYLKKVNITAILLNIFILLGGCVLCFSPNILEDFIEVIAGFLLLTYSVSEVISLINLIKAENKNSDKKGKNFKYGTLVQEAEFEKVEDDSTGNSR